VIFYDYYFTTLLIFGTLAKAAMLDSRDESCCRVGKLRSGGHTSPMFLLRGIISQLALKLTVLIEFPVDLHLGKLTP